MINDSSFKNKTYTLASNDPTVTEGDISTKNLTFTLTLDSEPTSDVTVDYETLPTLTATAGDDFIASSGTVTFAAGSKTATVNVVIKGDTTYENSGTAETVQIKFSGDNLSATTTATGYITENDPKGSGPSNWTVHESTGSYSLVEDENGKMYARNKATNVDYAISTAFPQTTIRSGLTIRYNFGN